MNSMQRMMFSLLSKPKSVTYTVNGYSRQCRQIVRSFYSVTKGSYGDIDPNPDGTLTFKPTVDLNTANTQTDFEFQKENYATLAIPTGNKIFYRITILRDTLPNGVLDNQMIVATWADLNGYNVLYRFTTNKHAGILTSGSAGYLLLYPFRNAPANVPNIPAGSELSFKAEAFDLTAQFGAGNEPTTVAECEAYYGTKYIPFTGSGGTIRKATSPFMFYKNDELVETYDPQTPVLLGSGESMTFDLPNGITRVIDGNGIELEFE